MLVNTSNDITFENELVIHISIGFVLTLSAPWYFFYLSRRRFQSDNAKVQYNSFLVKKLTSHNWLLSSVWTNNSARAELAVFLWFRTKTLLIWLVCMNYKKHLFDKISMSLQKKSFFEILLIILPRSLFNTLIDMLYSAFVSKVLICKNSFILLFFYLPERFQV